MHTVHAGETEYGLLVGTAAELPSGEADLQVAHWLMPFYTTAAVGRRGVFEGVALPANVQVLRTPAGGHVGFLGRPGRPGGFYWLDAVPNLSEFYSVNYSSIHGDDPIDGVQDFWAEYEERFGPTVVGVSVTGYSIIQA